MNIDLMYNFASVSLRKTNRILILNPGLKLMLLYVYYNDRIIIPMYILHVPLKINKYKMTTECVESSTVY